MATSLALKRGTKAAKLFHKLRSVSAATPSVQRCFNTNSSQVEAYDEFNRTVEEDRRHDASVSRRRDNDLFSDIFDPFSQTRSLSQIMNMMDQLANNPFAALRGFGLETRRGWDAKEDDGVLNLRFDMPGLDKENVKISVDQNTLIIKGETEEESEESEERRRYSSQIDLPMEVYKLDEIQAEMKNGVLKIVVPKVKSEERKDVREIEVK